ncbi:MAG: urease accessory protein UreD [Rhodobacterales bacterium]|nr:urease accessory protein UreD [Rhodobacterales bacterium]
MRATMQVATLTPRAQGALRLVARAARGGSVIDTLRTSGSLKALFPRAPGAALQAVFLNTAGGLTGGDRMEVDVAAEAGAHLVVASQAAERAYRAQPGSHAEVTVALRVAAGARIDWLPQETILFEGAALRRRLRVDLAPGGRVLLCEPVIFGRAAMGEVLHAAALRDRWEVWQGGRLIWADALRLEGDIAAHLARAGCGGGAGAMAGLAYGGPDAAALLAPLRALLPPTCGVSLLPDGLLVLRLLMRDGFTLRRALIPVIERLTGAPLPKVWRL